MLSVLLLVALLFCSLNLYDCRKQDYAIVIDAGSTGTRCFVFHVLIDLDESRSVTSNPCGRVFPGGLSTLVAEPHKTTDIILPLLTKATHIIPARYHSRTKVYIKGTAGMRLLSDEDQEKIWTTLVNSLNNHEDNPFHISMESVGTIDGHAEAFYAVLASNYIAGSIDGNLHPVAGKTMIGALDMGGSSTQLIFYNGTNDRRKIHANDFWSHSWLNYGVHRVQERIFDYLYDQYIISLDEGYMNSTRSQEELLVVPNPCGFAGHEEHYLPHVLFQGTGQGEDCFHLIEQVIWPSVSDSFANDNKTFVEEISAASSVTSSRCERDRACAIDEIEHPSVHGHHFYAMSVYYFALDLLRLLSPVSIEQHWPTPSLAELEEAAQAFCHLSWSTVHSDYLAHGPNPFTREDQLSDRCFESLYIITILEKGFAFDRHSRNITFALEIEGSEVEWTLGFALAEVDFLPYHAEKVVIPWTTRWAVLFSEKLTDLFLAPIQNVLAFVKEQSFWRHWQHFFSTKAKVFTTETPSPTEL